ncbi:MAG: D-tyrosyl-tRNA(Tyr) deacylase [Clostridia bacterium]|nr:D-tyrosyl-tRNA(Tyr) deacylase [Clostridia bacterium]
MIAVLQRVSCASVTVDGKVVGSCGAGLCILLGVGVDDTKQDAELLATKISKTRIFTDADDKMNLSVKDIGGSALVVSNFTLLANYRHGNRPDYMNAARPDVANELYEYFKELLGREVPVEGGVFGAHMHLNIENDGPVTIVMDSGELKKKSKG